MRGERERQRESEGERNYKAVLSSKQALVTV